MIEQSAVVKRNTFRFLTLLCSIILALPITSCGCNNFHKTRGPKDIKSVEDSKGNDRNKDKSNTSSSLEIKHDLTTNQVTVILHNQGTAIANIQLDYANISPDDKGKTALLDGRPMHTILAANIPAGGSETFTWLLDFREGREATFTFQVQQDGAETIKVNKTFHKPIPEVRLKLMDEKNSVGLWGGEFPLYYRIVQESDKIPVDHTKLSLEIKNQEPTTEESAIFYNKQKITALQLSGTQLNEVGGAMDRLPITLGPSTTSVSVTLQLFYEGIPMEGPKPFSWQANHSGPTQALFNAIFCDDLSKTAELLAANPTLIHATDEGGDTALHKALQNKTWGCSRLALKLVQQDGYKSL